MKKKAVALFIVKIIYLAAFAVGAVVLWVLKPLTHPFLALFAADAAATVVVFIFNLILKNASVYDPYWSVQPLFVIAAMYFFYEKVFQLSHLAALVPLTIWAIRLTYNWVKGFENLAWEDWRYKMFKTKNPRIAQFVVFTGIMMMPTILVFLGTIPFWYILEAENPNILLLIAGGVIILTGTLFEILADTSMHRYKKNTSRGPYIDEGLWRYSRHPNYLGEILIWVGVFVAGLSNFHFYSLPGVVLMILLFTCISAPMMEKHILEKRPEYKEYQKKVWPLVFGPRRK